jgi:hypothetical protein
VFSAPRLLTGPESLLLAAVGAAVGAFLVFRFSRWSAARARAAGAIAAALVASSLAVAPVTAWAVISDIRDARQLSERDAARIGPEERGLDTAVLDRVAALIPSDETYALVISDNVDPDRRLLFRLWALSALLPRVAVTDPSSSHWFVGWGVPPPAAGVSVAGTKVLRSNNSSDAPVYVGRVTQ